MMQIFALSGLINGICALCFGLLIIAKNWRGRMNQLFFMMCLSVAIWAFSYWRWLSATDFDAALFWVRMLSIGSLFIPIFYFHWCTTLLKINLRFTYLVHGMYVIAALLLAISNSSFFISTVRPALFFPFWPRPGIMYTIYLIFIYLGLVLYAGYLMLRHYKEAPNEERGQIVYILLGTIFGFGGGASNFLLWYEIPIAPYGNILVMLFPFFLGYAVIKHHLFDMPLERYLDFGLLGLVVLFGIFLIRSVWREVEQREQISALAFKLSAANAELKKLDAAKSEFISIAGHQLRTPLTVIKGYTSMVLEGSFGQVAEKSKEALNRVLTASTALAKLVSDLLDLSRIETGKIKYEFKEVQIKDIVHGVLQELEETAKSKNINLEFTSENVRESKVIGDFDKLHEVIINLVDNAIKYSAIGPISISLKKTARDGAGQILLAVEDHGMGIKPEDIPNLFIKFGRSDEAKKVRPDGMGLGLYFVKKIIEDHKGRVWVESPGIGQGSTFFIELPVQ